MKEIGLMDYLFVNEKVGAQERSQRGIYKYCEQCGELFFAVISRMKAGGGVFCSRICSFKYHKQENASNYVQRITAKCKYCGKEFEIRETSDQIFCSRKCTDNYRSENYVGEKSANWKGGKVKRICKECGKEFEVFPYVLNVDRGKFCSQECAGKYTSKHRTGENSAKYNRIHVNCDNCGKDMYIIKCHFERNEHHFCSQECHGEYTRSLPPEKCANWQGGKVKRICLNCGEEFEVFPRTVRYGYGKFCSKDCQNEYKVGENAVNWKGGISYVPYCPKFNNNKKEEIREKYGRKCFICDKTEEDNGAKLSCHHVDYNKNQGCDGNKWALVPLCGSCHSKTNHNRKLWEVLLKYKLWCEKQYDAKC